MVRGVCVSLRPGRDGRICNILARFRGVQSLDDSLSHRESGLSYVPYIAIGKHKSLSRDFEVKFSIEKDLIWARPVAFRLSFLQSDPATTCRPAARTCPSQARAGKISLHPGKKSHDSWQALKNVLHSVGPFNSKGPEIHAARNSFR